MVIAFLALILIGPDRLPEYAAQLGKLVRTLKEMMSGAKTTLKEELGDDYAELQKFDPRQYDPRRIVRDALIEDVVPGTKRRTGVVPPPVAGAAGTAVAAGSVATEDGEDGQPGEPVSTVPFDEEAT